jgi:hypothetical protein
VRMLHHTIIPDPGPYPQDPYVLGLPDQHPDTLFTGTDPNADPAPGPFLIKGLSVAKNFF